MYMASVLQNKITCTDSLIDEAFDSEQTRGFKLHIQLGIDGAVLTVNEKKTNKYIAFERYNFQQTYTFDDVCMLLDEIIQKSPLVKHVYHAVDCVVVNNLSTLVPKAVFEEEKIQTYLKFNVALAGDEYIVSDELRVLDAKNIFALPQCLKTKLDQLFPTINYHHFSSVLIDSLLRQHKNQGVKKLFVHIQPSHFQIIVLEGKSLLFYNTFNHHTAEDFIYYLLFVCEQLHLNPEKTELVLLGEVDKNSAIYAIAHKYIRNLSFGERSDAADFSYQLQNLPKHSYFTLFNTYLS